MTSFEQIQEQKILLETTINQQSSAIKYELNKIDNLQAKVRQMQSQLLSLNKLERSCDKKNKNQIHSTLLTIRNRVFLTQTHTKNKQRHNQSLKKLKVQTNKIKEIRQKQISQLENAKRQNQQMKENMMKQIRQISNKNQSIIRKTKQNQLEKNKIKANMIKDQKQLFKQSLIESKIKEMRQKHQMQMTRSQIRIQQKQELQKRFQSLIKEKQMIESRVQQKKDYNKRLQSLKKNICKMKDNDISKTIRQIKKKLKTYEKDKEKQSQQDQNTKQIQQDEQYIKCKLFQKYFEAQQVKREQKENWDY